MRHFLESRLKETKPACPNIIPLLLNKYALFHSFIPSTDIYQKRSLRVSPRPAGSGIEPGLRGMAVRKPTCSSLSGEPRQSRATEDRLGAMGSFESSWRKWHWKEKLQE